MNGNIYNNISKQINYKLPDINFDSDSDEVDDGQPVKPFIRPSADILFGRDDSDSEEIVRMLSQLPDDNSIACKPPVGEHFSQDSAQSPIRTYELPFNNIHLPSGILHRDISDTSAEDCSSNRVVLPKFGVRDHIDLDKVLEEIDMSSYKTSFFDDVLDMVDSKQVGVNANDCSSNSEVLNRLDEMSRRYERDYQNENNSNSSTVGKGTSRSYPLSVLFDQVKRDAARDTVILDLRVENALWNAPTVAKAPVASGDASDQHEPYSDRPGSSSDDGDDDDDDEQGEPADPRQGLWIDNYRRAKLAHDRSSAGPRDVTVPSDMATPSAVLPDTSTPSAVAGDRINTNPDCAEPAADSPEERVRLKVKQIQQRETALAEIRQLIGQLVDRIPGHRWLSGELHWPCVLLHEHVSLVPPAYRLVPPQFEHEQQLAGGDTSRLFSAFIAIAPPACVLTSSRLPSPVSAPEHGPANFVALLALLLRSTSPDDAPDMLAFRVVGLQQICRDGHVQLALLCQMRSSLSRVRAQLKKSTLSGLLATSDRRFGWEGGLPAGLTSLALANFLLVQPFDAVQDGPIWRWDNSSIAWHTLPALNRCGVPPACALAPPDGVDTSCVLIRKDLLVSPRFPVLLTQLLDRFSLAGIRYLHSNDGDAQDLLVLAVRGFQAVATIAHLQPDYSPAMTCTRPAEDASRDLCSFFGPRCTVDRLRMELEEEDSLVAGPELYQGLWRAETSDAILLVSPAILDVGWVVHTLLETCGFVLVSLTRLRVSVPMGRQLGVPESALDQFAAPHGVCHLLVVRGEHPMHSLPRALDQCVAFMSRQSGQSALVVTDRVFFAAAYCDALMDVLEVPRAPQTPLLREPVCDPAVPEAPWDDCEQCSFVLLVSDELTRHVAQLLDQMSSLDLLAVKCFSGGASAAMDQDHLALLHSQFEHRLPPSLLHPGTGADIELAEPPKRVALLVVRSMYLIRELDSIRTAIKVEKNFVFAFTVSAQSTFHLISAFFTDSELLSNPRRRSALRFLPASLIRHIEQSPIDQQQSAMHMPVCSALTLQIASARSVLSQVRKIWILLARDGFIVSQSVLDQHRRLCLLVDRPNAIFYLIQWAHYHNGVMGNGCIEAAASPSDVASLRDQVALRIAAQTMPPVVTSELIGADLATRLLFVMVKYEMLLDTGHDALAFTKLLWAAFEETDCLCLGLMVTDVTGSIMFKIRDISLRNLNGLTLNQETRYMCLLLASECRCGSAMRDSIGSKLASMMKAEDSRLVQDVYFNADPSQIGECCNILLPGAVAKVDCLVKTECDE